MNRAAIVFYRSEALRKKSAPLLLRSGPVGGAVNSRLPTGATSKNRRIAAELLPPGNDFRYDRPWRI
jgi:hypothetical protein